MNRTQLRKEVLKALPPFYRRRLGQLAHRIATLMVDTTLSTIMDATLRGEKVVLDGFGSFDTSVRKPHLVYTNLSKQPEYKVTRPYVRVFLRPCTAWKKQLADGIQDQFQDHAEAKKTQVQLKGQKQAS